MTQFLNITWDEILDALEFVDEPGKRIYGVPKGGMIATAFLQNALPTHNPADADIILDDLVDSGKTKALYQKRFPDKEFACLVDKQYLPSKPWIVFPWERDHPGGEDNIQQNLTRQLQYIGEDPNREGLLETPNRIVRSWEELYSGYNQDPADLLTTFDTDGYDQIVLLKDIQLYSMCEHHMLPFVGKAHVAYIPNGRVIGVSKLARLVDIYSRRLQIQERLGEQVTTALMKHLQPRGAACVIQAEHMCMRMRGCSQQSSTMVTSSIKGVFMEKGEAREELMQLIQGV